MTDYSMVTYISFMRNLGKEMEGNMLFRIIVLGWAVLVGAACTNKDDYRQSSVQEATGQYPSLFSVDSFVFDPQGSLGEFSYIANNSWRVSQKPDWLSVTPDSGGEGRAVVKISAGMNNDWEDRSGKIVFAGADGQAHEIDVRQDCPRLAISIDSKPDGLEEVFENNPGKSDPDGLLRIPFLWSHSMGRTEPIALVVTSNLNWEIDLSDNVDFAISVDRQNWGSSFRGNGDQVIYLNCLNNNYSKEDFNDSLTLTAYTDDTFETSLSKGAVASWTVDVTQSHLMFLLRVNEGEWSYDNEELTFDELGFLQGTDMANPSLDIQCELPWNVVSSSFARLDSFSGGAANEQVHRSLRIVHPQNSDKINPSLEEQVDTLFFRAQDQDGGSVAERFVVVKQRPYLFTLDTDSFDLENGVFLEGDTRSFQLDGQSPKVYTLRLHTTGAWRLDDLDESSAEWLDIDPSTRSGRVVRDAENAWREIRFWVRKQNLRMEDIVAHLQLRPDYDWATTPGQIHADVPVTQARFDFSVELMDTDDLSATQVFADGVRRSLKVTSSGPWHLEKTNSWIHTEKERGNANPGDNSVTEFSVGAEEANPSDQSRSATLYFISDLHEELPASEREDYKRQVVTLVQRRFTFMVNDVEGNSTMVIPAYRKSFDSALKIQSDGNWRINSCPDWMNPAEKSASISGGDVNRNVLLNPNVYGDKTSARTGIVSVTCSYPGRPDITREITVEQQPLVFSVSGSSAMEFPPVCNFSYNGSLLNPMSWNYAVSATDELPWKIVPEDNDGFPFCYGDQLISVFSGEGTEESAHLYPYYNESRQSHQYSFHFETADARFSTPVRADGGSFRLTQRPYEWDGQAVNNMSFGALSSVLSGNPAIDFVCSGPWVIDNLPSWCAEGQNVDHSSNPSFTLSVQTNVSNEADRTADITIRSIIGNYTKSFRVSQSRYYFDETPVSDLNFAALDAPNQSVTFTCAGDWSVSSSSGLVLSASSGTGNERGQNLTLRFHPEDYFEESSARESFFEIRSTVTSGSESRTYSKQISFHQDAYVFSVSESSIALSSPKDVTSRDISVRLSSGDRWTASCDNTSVVEVSPVSGQSGSGTLKLQPIANFSQSARSALVTLVSERGKKTRTITVSQPEYRFSSSSASVAFEAEGGEQTITITSDGNWTLEKASAANWLTISRTSGGAGTTSVTLTATANSGSGAADRSVNLTLKGADSNTLNKTISVSQSK